MELSQRTELKKLMVPQLRQSLKILTLPLFDLKAAIQNELENNPFLELSLPEEAFPKPKEKIKTESFPSSFRKRLDNSTDLLDLRVSLITQKASLQDILLRQSGMFTDTDEDLLIGQEIIGNIDENGYLKAGVDEIAGTLNVNIDKVEKVLAIIQQFEPSGVAARTIAECLLIQLELSGEKNPLIRKIVEFHLEDVAKKNYKRIAKSLKEPLEKIEPLIKIILKLNPKPGRNYSTEEVQRVVPDIIIKHTDGGLKIAINQEDISALCINKEYRDMLKNGALAPEAKEFLSAKLQNALDLVRAVSKRQETLRKIVEVIVAIQEDALKEGFLSLKPITFKEIALRIEMHESTVCRAVMNKNVELPDNSVIALRDFFSSHVHTQDGVAVSSIHIKMRIKELIGQEDKRYPLSDQDISDRLLKERKVKVSRRTVAKYREDLRMLSSPFRRVR